MSEQDPQSHSWLQEHRRALGASAAAMAAGMIAWAAPGLINRSGGDSEPHPSKITPSAILPPFPEQLASDQQVYDEAAVEFEGIGYAAAVTPPRPSDETAYFDDYLEQEGGLPYSDAPMPKLREVAYVLDDQAFSPDVNQAWGFRVYNATDKPIDIPFIRFSAEFLKQWIDSRPASGITVDNSIGVKVSSDEVMHTIALVDELPPSAVDAKINGAVTYNYVGSDTLSWVMWGDRHELHESAENIFGRTNHEYKRYSSLGVEMCQSMLNLSDGHMLFGAASMATVLQGWANEGATSGRDLTRTAHEIVCNTLGRALAVYWLYGQAGLPELEGGDASIDRYVVGLQSTPVYEYSLAISDLAAMATIKSKIEQNSGNLSIVDGSKTPTTQSVLQAAGY